MSVPVDFRVGRDFPPLSAIPHTIYADVINLPNPVTLGLTARIYNYDDVGLYMKVDGYNGAWTFVTKNLGLLGSGGNFYKHMDALATRARPTSETLETVTIRLRAYTDAGYSVLKWTFLRTIDVWFIKSDDGSWTQDFLNNFDDGTIQGWDRVVEAGSVTTNLLIASTDYVLSAPYSLRHELFYSGGATTFQAYLFKNFNTPNRAKVLVIADVRCYGSTSPTFQWMSGQQYIGTTLTDLLVVGTPDLAADSVPRDRWMRMVFPITPNTVNLQVRLRYRMSSGWATTRFWLDDFKIISKN